MLSRNSIVEIDINSKKIEISYIDYEENTINPDSKEGIEILDKWHDKWVRIIERLRLENKSVILELTGGFDSRINFGLMKNSNVNADEIYIRSGNYNFAKMKKDYNCAKELADKYGYTLNNEVLRPKIKYNYSISDIMEMFLYTKCGRHNLIYPNLQNREEYIITGYCGECMREYWAMGEKECIASFIFKQDYPCVISKKTIENFYKSRDKILKTSFKEIKNKYEKFGRNISDKDISRTLYKEVRVRNHFGGRLAEQNQGGGIRLAPLSDSNLYKLALYNEKCKDKNLFMALYYVRYNMDLLEVPFSEGKTIDKETIEYAKEINKKYPYRKVNIKNTELIAEEEQKQVFKEIQEIDKEKFSEYIKNIFNDKEMKKIFYSEYNEEIYKYLDRDTNKDIRHPLHGIITFLSICKVIKCCKDSKKNNRFLDKIKKIKLFQKT